MSERRGPKGLELWCRRMTEGYPGVTVNNMTTSWRDGLAFCAIIHHFRPDLIEFGKLNKEDIYYNNDLAFQVAERHLGIPALLEPGDMVDFPVPDRLSILTYLSQFYRIFGVADGSPSRIVPKRPAIKTTNERAITPSTPTTPPKVARVSGGGSRREPCAKCGLPVFIAERLNVGKHLYHRTCFRCARCNSQLTLASYYETELEKQFCCETCPDEEVAVESAVLNRSLSDEEKTASLRKQQLDEYSNIFETALENLATADSSPANMARSQFINSQLDSEASGDELPNSKPPPKPAEETVSECSGNGKVESQEHSEGNSISESCDSGFPSIPRSLDSINKSERSDRNEQETASGQPNVDNVVTKENKFRNDNGEEVSVVKSRLRLFESKLDEASKEVGSKSDRKFIHKVPSHKQSSIVVIDVECSSDSSKDNVSSESVASCIEQESSNKGSEECTRRVDSIDDTKESSEVDSSKLILSDSSIQTGDESVVISVTSSNSNDDTKHSSEVDSLKLVLSDSLVQITDESVIAISDSSSNSDGMKRLDLIATPSDASKSVDELYPENLNPFGDDDEDNSKMEISNPFDNDDEVQEPSPKPAVRKKIKPRESDLYITGKNEGTPEGLDQSHMVRISYNPFEDDSDGSDDKPAVMKLLSAPKISLNPFWSDEDEPEDGEESKVKPVPFPRNARGSITTPEPKPRKSGLSSGTHFGSTSSLSSTQSSLASAKKKKQAPRPPLEKDSAHSSVASSPNTSKQHSPKSVRSRKSKRAPLPPAVSSTPYTKTAEITAMEISCIPFNQDKAELSPESPFKSAGDWEKEKILKDETNRNRQSQVISPTPSENSEFSKADKSTYGKWKRRKGPAPSRPIPQRRHIKPLPIVEIKKELELIEVQQQGLEKQGVRLEQIIRERCEGPDSDLESSLSADVEDLILQLFELVNEKNELFRKQTELMYLRRQQRLEEEYADLEYQIRCIMLQPEANKTDSDKTREEELINRLVAVVERRNEIVECLEMDRVREAEEDDSIINQIQIYTNKKEDGLPKPQELKKKKKKDKIKLKVKKIDMDKDIDESESSNATSQQKVKKKKKFNLF